MLSDLHPSTVSAESGGAKGIPTLANSAVAFLATRLAGQTVADGTPIYAIGSLAGAVVGTAIGLRWVSPRMIRVILAAILLASGLRMLAG